MLSSGPWLVPEEESVSQGLHAPVLSALWVLVAEELQRCGVSVDGFNRFVKGWASLAKAHRLGGSTLEVHPLSVLEAGTLRSRWWEGWAPSEGTRGSVPGSVRFCQLPGWRQRNPASRDLLPVPVCVCISPFCKHLPRCELVHTDYNSKGPIPK